jgi:site-specific DNA-cytosine methylase
LNDKKDDLFAHYLDVISVLQPKYFVMENVKGILTKDKGKHRERIMREIESIVDLNQIEPIVDAIETAARMTTGVGAQRLIWVALAVKECCAERRRVLAGRTKIERAPEEPRVAGVAEYAEAFRACASHLSYRLSKTDRDVLTVRHALNLLGRPNALGQARAEVNALLVILDPPPDQGQGLRDFLRQTSAENLLATAVRSASALAQRHGNLVAFKEFAEQLDRGQSGLRGEEVHAALPLPLPTVHPLSQAVGVPREPAVEYALRLAQHKASAVAVRHRLAELKSLADVGDDELVRWFDECISALDVTEVTTQLSDSLSPSPNSSQTQFFLRLLDAPMSELLTLTEDLAREFVPAMGEVVREVVRGARLYTVAPEIHGQGRGPWILNAAQYGVPQTRQRVAFVGVRKDQNMIQKPAPTVDTPTTVLEALWDLDFIGNGERSLDYDDVKANDTLSFFARKNATAGTVAKICRSIDGATNKTEAPSMSYAEWSRVGRIRPFTTMPRWYFASEDAMKAAMQPNKSLDPRNGTAKLQNHDASKHTVIAEQRMQVMVDAGKWTEELRNELAGGELATDKRDYTVLDWKGQAPTVMTIADDFVHYRQPRAPTVREMARLQSFDDDFVFQGKRTTGGDRRKDEVPQFTLVGNAVPPLMARAIAMELLRGLTRG